MDDVARMTLIIGLVSFFGGILQGTLSLISPEMFAPVPWLTTIGGVLLLSCWIYSSGGRREISRNRRHRDGSP